VARRYNVPVASCNTAYMNEREMPYWKITAVRETFRHDHPSSAIDPRIHDPSYDLTVCKKAPSIFFETGQRLLREGACRHRHRHGLQHLGLHPRHLVDSFSHRFRTIVPEDCVGDIEEQPHRDNLRDLGRRYVDVVDLATCLAYLEEWRKKNVH
jgi:maleamate amidohydrolase